MLINTAERRYRKIDILLYHSNLAGQLRRISVRKTARINHLETQKACEQPCVEKNAMTEDAATIHYEGPRVFFMSAAGERSSA